MELLTQETGLKPAIVKGKKGGKGHFWSWKKFASLIDKAGTGKAKIAGGSKGTGLAGVASTEKGLNSKSNEQLLLSKALMDRAKPGASEQPLAIKSKRAVKAGRFTGKMGQLLTPVRPMNLPPLVLIRIDPNPTGIKGKGHTLETTGVKGTKGEKGEKSAKDGLETILQLLSLNLEQAKEGKQPKKGEKKAAEFGPFRAEKPSTGKPMTELGALMAGKGGLDASSLSGQGSDILRELAAVMGLKDGSKAQTKEGRLQAVLADMHKRADPKVIPKRGKGESGQGVDGRTPVFQSKGKKGQVIPEAKVQAVGQKWTSLLDQIFPEEQGKKSKGTAVPQSKDVLQGKVVPQSKDVLQGKAVQQAHGQVLDAEVIKHTPLDKALRTPMGHFARAIEEAAANMERKYNQSKIVGSAPEGQTKQSGDGGRDMEKQGANPGTQSSSAKRAPHQVSAQASPKGTPARGPGQFAEPGFEPPKPGAEAAEAPEPGARIRPIPDHARPKGDRKIQMQEPGNQDVGPRASQMNKGESVKETRAPAPPPRPPQPMFSQVEAGLRHAYIVRPKSVTVKIVPEELGEIQVQVTTENDKIHAKIRAETQRVVSILKDHQSELQNRMQEQGVELESLEVREDDSYKGNDERREGRDAGGPGGDRQQRENARAQAEAVEADAKPKTVEEKIAADQNRPIVDANGRVSVTA